MFTGLLGVSQVSSVFCKTVYQQVMTDCCFVSEMKAYYLHTHTST